MFFDEIIKSIENDDIKEFANKCIETIPEYFWEVPASSTMKYHPKYACSVPLGLAKHTLALCIIMNHAFELECFKEDFTSRERDLMRIAGMMHDTRKSGSQKEYEINKYTKFNHPELAAKVVYDVWKEFAGSITKEEINILCKSIMSHMGQWNTDKRNPGVELPKPKTKYEKLVHFCDYLASRKNIEIIFDNISKEEKSVKSQFDPIEYQVPFGKYSGLTWPEIEKENPGYIDWVLKNITEGEAISVLKKYLEEKA